MQLQDDLTRGQEKRLTSKHPQNNLTNVLHRPVESATASGHFTLADEFIQGVNLAKWTRSLEGFKMKLCFRTLFHRQIIHTSPQIKTL
jgi:hypothetical protein